MGSPATVGAPSRIRTCDARFRKPTLYPLSYEGLAPQASRSQACAAILNGVARAEDEAGAYARAVLREGGQAAVRLLLHPSLRWTRADGSLLPGRVAVLAALEAEPPDASPPSPSCAAVRSTAGTARPGPTGLTPPG